MNEVISHVSRTGMRSRVRLGELLMEAGSVSPDELMKALDRQKGSGKRLGEVLIQLSIINEAGLARCLAIQWGFPFLDLELIAIDPKAVGAVHESLSRRHRIMPVTLDHRALTVAMADPLDFEAVQNIAFSTGFQVIPAVATPGDISEAIERHYPDTVSVKQIVGNSIPEIQDIVMK